jgi:hypothetical protein
MLRIDRYSKRWYWRDGIMASEVGLIGAGLVLASATEETDANGEKKPSTPVPGILAVTGLLAVTFSMKFFSEAKTSVPLIYCKYKLIFDISNLEWVTKVPELPKFIPIFRTTICQPF